jgi:hypothetical protein
LPFSSLSIRTIKNKLEAGRQGNWLNANYPAPRLISAG